MSWSIFKTGKPAAVAVAVKADADRVTCAEPEQSIKAAAVDIIERALAAFPEGTAVKVEASGSQSTDSSKPGKATNSLKILIEPIFGFVE